MPIESIPVRPGQVWADNDKRSVGRYVKVVEVDADRATVRQVAYNEEGRISAELPGARVTRIRLDRFRPTTTGYRLIQEAPMKRCDNASVGVIITNADCEYLMFDRATFPPGTAPAAGHVDDHGTLRAAARAEVEEELGLHVEYLRAVTGGWRGNRCRRLPGAAGVGHQWTVFAAAVTGDLAPSARETKNVRWIAAADLQALADRTVAYARDQIGDQEFAGAPGIEPVWVQWLANVGAVTVAYADLLRIDQLAATSTPTEQPGA